MDAPAIEYVPAGISRASADGRYVRRFVGATLAADTYLGNNSAGVGQEVVFANPNGPVMGGIPLNANPALLVAGDGARFMTRVRLVRLGNTPTYAGLRINGTAQAPTQTLNGESTVAIGGNALTDTGTIVTPALISAFMRENPTATAFGAGWTFQAVDIGNATLKGLFNMRGGGANIGELQGIQPTTRIFPNTLGSLRNPANTQDQIAWNATGYGVHGSAPIAKPTITGSRGGNAALASLLTALALYGHITDSTTA